MPVPVGRRACRHLPRGSGLPMQEVESRLFAAWRTRDANPTSRSGSANNHPCSAYILAAACRTRWFGPTGWMLDCLDGMVCVDSGLHVRLDRLRRVRLQDMQ